MATVQRIKLDGRRYVVVPEAEFEAMAKAAEFDTDAPLLPAADAEGNRPALEAMRVMTARNLIHLRRAKGMTQHALATATGVRQETISRAESGKSPPAQRTLKRLLRVLAPEELAEDDR